MRRRPLSRDAALVIFACTTALALALAPSAAAAEGKSPKSGKGKHANERPFESTRGLDFRGVDSCRDQPLVDFGLVPGTRHERESFSFTRNRTVHADNQTVLLAVALGKALDRPVAFTEVSNFREERVEVCAFQLFSTIPGRDAVNALALGVRVKEASALDALAGDTQLVVIVEVERAQNVSLDADVVFAALALHGAGGSVKFEDVVTIAREERVIRTSERLLTIKSENVLSVLALRSVA